MCLAWDGLKGLEVELVTKFTEMVKRAKEQNQLDPIRVGRTESSAWSRIAINS